MRLWSLHPRYLDAKGLVALWREALLAKAVLAGRTKGYRAHPQLSRFRRADDPGAAIRAYLEAVFEEARKRGYRFDARKLGRRAAAKAASGGAATANSRSSALPGQTEAAEPGAPRIPVTEGQIAHEVRHLLAKLGIRDPERRAALAAELKAGRGIEAHPLFRVVPGGAEDWEVGAARPPAAGPRRDDSASPLASRPGWRYINSE